MVPLQPPAPVSVVVTSPESPPNPSTVPTSSMVTPRPPTVPPAVNENAPSYSATGGFRSCAIRSSSPPVHEVPTSSSVISTVASTWVIVPLLTTSVTGVS